MIDRLLASNIRLIPSAPYEPADPFLFVGKLFRGDKILGIARMLLEQREQLGTLVFRKKAKGNCGDQVVTAFRPS
jgi:hypothetical protein